MNQPDAETKITNSMSTSANRTVHDLRAPLVIALGYLGELTILRQDLLNHYSTEDKPAVPQLTNDHIRAQLDTEMGLCIDIIRDSLEGLDNVITDQREQLQTIDLTT